MEEAAANGMPLNQDALRINDLAIEITEKKISEHGKKR
jgi:hypothetical protein